MFKGKLQTLWFSLILAITLTACGSEYEDSTEESSLTEAPPSDLARITQCELAPLSADAKQAKFRGRKIQYFNSSEIPYENSRWWSQGQAWLSWDGLDASVLGYPGFPGKDRNFRVSSPVNLRITAIDVRNIEGTPHYHYFSNETALSPMENWSSTKSIVMTQAAHSIRQQTQYAIGLLAKAGSNSGKNEEWIATHVNHVARTSHNETANWFKSITGSQGSQNFLQQWLSTNDTFGGLHSSAFAPLGNQVRLEGSSSFKPLITAGKWVSNGLPNTVMPITMAEFWKRIALNEKDPKTWLKRANYSTLQSNVEAKKLPIFKQLALFHCRKMM